MATINPLFSQRIAAGDSKDPTHWPRHRGLLREFAEDNDLRESGEFTLDALSRGLHSGGAWGERYRWPGCDHDHYFRRDRRAMAVVTQPYVTRDVDALRVYAAEKGLVMHMPPSPLASFWYPGATYFIVLTAPSFGRVRWIPAQLNFERDAS